MLLDHRFAQPIPAGLTRMPAKAALYALDTWFREGWEDLQAIAGGGAQELAFRHAMMLVKPDALATRRLETVLDWLPEQGFDILACVPMEVGAGQLKALWRYQWNCAQRIRKDAYLAMFTASVSVLLVVRSPPDLHISARLAHPVQPAGARRHPIRSVGQNHDRGAPVRHLQSAASSPAAGRRPAGNSPARIGKPAVQDSHLYKSLPGR